MLVLEEMEREQTSRITIVFWKLSVVRAPRVARPWWRERKRYRLLSSTLSTMSSATGHDVSVNLTVANFYDNIPGRRASHTDHTE
jgi:hypothetical protein